MTFLQLQQAVYRRVKLADSPASADVTRIKQFINLWHRRILAKPGMDRCRDTTLTFATVANQQKYGLPQALSKVRSVFDITNQRRLDPQTVDWLRSADPGLTATSSLVSFWIPLNGWGALAQEVSSAGKPLYAVSDSASDTTQKVYVETIRLGGVRAGTAVSTGTTITGTSRVQIGTKSDHIDVVKVYLDNVAVGNISIYDASSSGNLLSQITIGRTTARYFMLQVYPTPSAAITISVDGKRALEELVNDTEEPLFHEDFHDVLVHYAAYEEWLNRDDSRAQNELITAQGPKGTGGILGDLLHYMLNDPDSIPVQRGPRSQPQRMSRLGGWYPANS